MRPDFLLFDWDNTLVESWHLIHQAMARTLRDFDLHPLTPEEIKVRVRLSGRDSFPAVFGDQAEQALECYRRHYSALDARPDPCAGVEAFLNRNTVPCGVISNKSHGALLAEVSALGWQAYFPLGLLGAGEAEADKPAPEVLEFFFRDDVVKNRGRGWYVGDTGVDVCFARNCGLVAVLIGDNLQPDDPRPDYHFSSIVEMSGMPGWS